MRTTLDIPDNVLKQAKIKAAEEGISLKELFTRSLVNELGKDKTAVQDAPWKTLKGSGSAKDLSPSDSPFEDYSGPDWNHATQVKERSEEHTSELQSRGHLVCRLLLEKKKMRRTQCDT